MLQCFGEKLKPFLPVKAYAQWSEAILVVQTTNVKTNETSIPSEGTKQALKMLAALKLN
jgi:hypothetical protein